jgi:hypothetical protein
MPITRSELAVELPCPECVATFESTLGELAQQDEQPCPACGHMNYVDSRQVARHLEFLKNLKQNIWRSSTK